MNRNRAFFLFTALLIILLSGTSAGCHADTYPVRSGEPPVKSTLTPEGWLVLENLPMPLLRTFCQAREDVIIDGCAVWVGPQFLSKPADQCLVMVRRDLDSQAAQFTLELELRHCREGSYHDANNNEIPMELRQQLQQFIIPGVTR